MSRGRDWFSKGTPFGLILLAFVVGVGGAFGATLFHILIALSTTLFYGSSANLHFINTVTTMPIWQRLLIPTIGGLLVGLIYNFSKVTEAEGEGVPEVTEALAHRRGTIRPIVAPVKILTAAITLGSGGSAGREGPVIQIGSAIGSTIGQFFKLDTPKRSLLLAAGAAAAIGGTFGAPIAGIIFTIEILRHKPNVFKTAILVLSAFTGATITKNLTGYAGLRFVGNFTLSISPMLIIGIIVLAVLAAIVAVAFGYALKFGYKTFAGVSIPHYIKPAFGGLAIGMTGLFLPYIHEPAAYPLMNDVMQLSVFPISFLLFVLLIKIFATSITLGSGGSGGIFAPLLLIGAITGTTVSAIFIYFGLLTTTTTPLFVLIGMATVFAGAAHAPFTAAFIAYETTSEIQIVIPLILSCLIASALSRKISSRSIYHHE